MDTLPDESLLVAMARGDDEATVAFIRRFQGRVFGVAVAVLGDSGLAEDVAQQTFERAWRHGATFDPRRGSVGTWVATIARNLAIDVSRTRRPQPVDPSELLLLCSSRHNPEDQAMSVATGERMRVALKALPAEQGRAVVLAGLVGMTASEIAAAEGIPLGTAKTRIRTAMSRLRLALESERSTRA
ncbi:sigma-70 family RNA polymerase sigma factor [Acidiferrimicrobium sp. IK]|uniref:RNA polymerase sigma factor n=1 Tax=Acidiferrimicrobium sp. IK TaxID=2871700 RepID=UPI0021CAF744|nr:sigma-70 family RNA polymerase sigma factor [Acidiferrimicrobium sp. IK]MCU4187321.1 sigma-70 family RNA polymerase sigma factor [Acidiferrimicrobium sp. IK]